MNLHLYWDTLYIMFVCRGHCQDHWSTPSLLHHSLELVWLCPRDCLHRWHCHGGHDGGLPGLSHPPQGGQGLQDREDTEAHQGKISFSNKSQLYDALENNYLWCKQILEISSHIEIIPECHIQLFQRNIICMRSQREQ